MLEFLDSNIRDDKRLQTTRRVHDVKCSMTNRHLSFSHLCSNSVRIQIVTPECFDTVHYYRITYILSKVNKKLRLNVHSMKGVQRKSFNLVTNSKDYTGRSS